MRKSSILLAISVFFAMMYPSIGAGREAAPPSAPGVTVVTPKNGTVVSGERVEISVRFESSEAHPVKKVEVYLDGEAITERRYDTPLARGTCSFLWDTVRTGDGQRRLDIQIFSESAYLGMATCIVTVSNERKVPRKPPDRQSPEVYIISPREGETVSGIVPIVIHVRDDSGREPYVAILVDKSLKSVRNYGPYSYKWDTSGEENGPHVIEVVAMDERANRADAKPVRVIVRNPVKARPFSSEEIRDVPASSRVSVVAPEEPMIVRGTGSQEYSRTVSDAMGIATERFEIARSASPVPNLPSLPDVRAFDAAAVHEPQSATDESVSVFEPNPVPTLEAPAAPSREPVSTAGSIPTPVPSEPISRSAAPAHAAGEMSTAPEASVLEPTTAPMLVARLPKPDIRPKFKPDRRLSVPVSDWKECHRSDAAEKGPLTAVAARREYVVQPGDNLTKIGKSFGVSAKAVAEANNLRDPNLIQIGQKLCIPTASCRAGMVSVRRVFEEVGGSVSWDGKRRIVHAEAPGTDVKLKVGSAQASVNNEHVTMEKPAAIISGRTVVPLSFVTKTLGMSPRPTAHVAKQQ